MRSRKPTKAETVYIEAAKRSVGCVACEILGRPNDAPVEYLAFHHNPDKGNTKPLCHFFGFPLCPVHHQGVTPSGVPIPPTEPVRHPQLGCLISFDRAVGNDLDCARYAWERISDDARGEIGKIIGVRTFDDLLRFSAEYDLALK